MRTTRFLLSLVFVVFVSNALAAKTDNKTAVCHIGSEEGPGGETYDPNCVPTLENNYFCSDAGKVDLIIVPDVRKHLGKHEYDGLADYLPEDIDASGIGQYDEDGDGIDQGCQVLCPCWGEAELAWFTTKTGVELSGACDGLTSDASVSLYVADSGDGQVFELGVNGNCSFTQFDGGSTTDIRNSGLTAAQIEACYQGIAALCDGFPSYCAIDEYVSNNTCTACPAGTTNEAGDDASLGNTSCDATLCAVDEYVSNNVCTACAAGTTNAAGDDASGVDTTCTPEGTPPTAANSAESVVEDSGLSSVFSMSGTSGTGEACSTKTGCTFAVAGCAAGSPCTLRAARNVQLPFGYFDADQNAVSLNYDAETGSFTLTPVANFYGTVDFTFTTSENGQTSAEATVTIDVTGVQDLIVEGPVVKAYDNFVTELRRTEDMRKPNDGFTYPDFSATGTPNGQGYALMIGHPGADGSKSFKDWRTGSGHWGPRSSDAVWIKNDANPLGKPGCLDATPTETGGACTFEIGDACVRRTHNIYNTDGDGLCKTGVAAQLHIEATAKEHFGKDENNANEPDWNAHYKMYITGVSGTGIQEIKVYMDHTFPGLDAPVELGFKKPISP